MPATAVAVSGRARAVSAWLNLVARLVVGADDQLTDAWQPSQRPSAGGAIRHWSSGAGPSSAAPTVPRRNADGLPHVPYQRTRATPTCS
jgi:hypothetical protein